MMEPQSRGAFAERQLAGYRGSPAGPGSSGLKSIKDWSAWSGAARTWPSGVGVTHSTQGQNNWRWADGGWASCGVLFCDPTPLPARHAMAEHTREASTSFTDASAVTSSSHSSWQSLQV